MGSNIMDIIRGIKSDRKRALEITESVATGSSFDRIRSSEADGIESRLLRIKDELKKSNANIDYSVMKEIDEGLSAIQGTRKIARMRAEGKNIEAKEKKAPEMQYNRLTQEEIFEKLNIAPDVAKKIKENPQAFMDELLEKKKEQEKKEAQEKLMASKEKKAQKEKEVIAKKKKLMG